MKFSENLKKQRILNGVKQEDIAILCDVTRSAVSNWENGRRLPQLSTIQTLTKFFNITIEELMGSDIQFIEYLEKESIVTPDEPKHFSKVPMIFALLTLVVVTLLTILIVPVVKDKYINNGNVNEVEYIDANSISKVSLILEYYNEVVSIDFEEYPVSNFEEGCFSDNGIVYIIDNLNTNLFFCSKSWGSGNYVQYKIVLLNEKACYELLDKDMTFSENFRKKIGTVLKLNIHQNQKYTFSFYISNNKYYLDVLQIN